MTFLECLGLMVILSLLAIILPVITKEPPK